MSDALAVQERRTNIRGMLELVHTILVHTVELSVNSLARPMALNIVGECITACT